MSKATPQIQMHPYTKYKSVPIITPQATEQSQRTTTLDIQEREYNEEELIEIKDFIAGFTPSADPLSMLLLAIPLISLYFMAGGIALLNDRRRSKKFKASEGGEGEIAPAAPIDSAAPIDAD